MLISIIHVIHIVYMTMPLTTYNLRKVILHFGIMNLLWCAADVDAIKDLVLEKGNAAIDIRFLAEIVSEICRPIVTGAAASHICVMAATPYF